MIAPAPAADAAIVVTVNPEARVSAKRGAGPLLVQCGGAFPLSVTILNEGRYRTALAVRADGATVSPAATLLVGGAKQTWTPLIRLASPRETLVTFTFDAGPATADLAGRATVDVLVRCVGTRRDGGSERASTRDGGWSGGPANGG